jgi:hypothetical protein
MVELMRGLVDGFAQRVLLLFLFFRTGTAARLAFGVLVGRASFHGSNCGGGREKP